MWKTLNFIISWLVTYIMHFLFFKTWQWRNYVRCRLTPQYFLVILFYILILPHLGSGPTWESRIGFERDNCANNWWANILYINNYVDPENMVRRRPFYSIAIVNIVNISKNDFAVYVPIVVLVNWLSVVRWCAIRDLFLLEVTTKNWLCIFSHITSPHCCNPFQLHLLLQRSSHSGHGLSVSNRFFFFFWKINLISRQIIVGM